MKIERITLTGFGAYKERTEIDLGRYSDAGLFLITGRTGAGKTTLLDAVTYALYGSIPSADSKGGDKARSHFCTPQDPTQVEVEFTDNGTRYLVARSPKYLRAKARGTGLTEQQEAASLSVWRDGAWEVLVQNQVRKVAEALEGIVTLSAEQFRQVILLAQGQFQEFLVASSEDRQKLLRTLFDSRRFEDYHAILKEQRDELRSGLTQTRAAVETIATSLSGRYGPLDGVVIDSATDVLAWLAPVLAEADDECVRCSIAERSAVEAFDAADRALVSATDRQARQQRRAATRDQVRRLTAEAPAVEQDRARLLAGRRAAVAWESVTAVRAARNHVDATLAEVHGAESTYCAQHDCAAPQSLDDVIETLLHSKGTLSTALRLEESLPSLAKEESSARVAVDQHAEAELDRSAQVAETEAALVAHRARILELEPQARELADATVAAQRTTQSHQSALEAVAIADDLSRAEAEQIEQGSRTATALSSLTRLRRRRHEGFAGTLAGGLVEGDPCAVCGSLAHPAPAETADAVTDAEIESAEETAEAARVALASVDARVLALKTHLADKQALAGGSVEETRLARDHAAAHLQRVQDLAHELTTERDAHDKTQLHLSELVAEGSLAAGRTAELAAALNAATRAHATASTAVDEARAGHPSVMVRRDLLTRQLTVAQELEKSRRRHDQACARLEEATSVMQEALLRAGFADAAAVDEARVPDTRLQEWERRVTQHDGALAAAEATLTLPELQGLGEESIDLAGPTADRAEALALRDAAVAARTQAAAVLAHLRDDQSALEALRAAGAKNLERYDVLHRLTETINGAGPNTQKMKLEAFVLAAELERVLEAANQRLGSMTSGRYELQHCEKAGRGTSGLNIEVLDAHTGEGRHPKSLSGGEKFQASLALALGLADVVTSDAGGLQLESLFIDEGFGSLDSETLETTMATLDGLREGGRTVGLISHVESLKERIPAQLLVEVAPGGWSVARQE